MTKRMLIDANHPEETRVVVLDGTRLEEFDVETSTKKQLKGNIYLAKVVRVEPSLQAAFVEYGGNRHGFLAFNEIHPDYYQIPVADREKLIAEEQAQAATDDDEDGDGESVETLGGDETEDNQPSSRSRSRSIRSYKIQEVIKRRQILLVQVVKEERGNKGAALTTYLSLAGRYCVFMPNTTRGGGVSRKITNVADRKRLKTIMGELSGPKGSAIILRTAGSERSKAEIKRDHDYLMRTWDIIRTTTLESRAPSLIHEEGSLIKRAIRDIYSRDIEEILVEGDTGYRTAKDFMKMLTPSHAKKVQPYKDEIMPLFHRYQVESQMDAMHSPVAQLKSGGYIVINQTEALVAIDVNSGRSTRERNIEETAYKTNLEAADEIARQLRLRDLSGLIVIDFIDMDDPRSNTNVERRVKDALRNDRARIQLGRISHFGLMELSRQRLRPSLMETSFLPCPHCHGTGSVRSIESTAVYMLRVIEEEGVRRRSSEVTVTVPSAVALYILNHKRSVLAAIEERYDFTVILLGDDSLIIPDHRMERIKAETRRDDAPAEAAVQHDPARMTVPIAEDEDEGEDDVDVDVEDEEKAEAEPLSTTEGPDGGSDDDTDASGRKRRRRRRRRGRRDTEGTEDGQDQTSGEEDDQSAPTAEDDADPSDEENGDAPRDEDTAEDTDDGEGDAANRGRRRRRRRRGRSNRDEATASDGSTNEGAANEEPTTEEPTSDGRNDASGTCEEAPPSAEGNQDANTIDEPTLESGSEPSIGPVTPVNADPIPSEEPTSETEATEAKDMAATEGADAEAVSSEEGAIDEITSEGAPSDANHAEEGPSPTDPESPADTDDSKPRRTGWWSKLISS
ncbi:MAG: Rne/Rng family ribonuclease [Rhodospirillum sp.]|nr:Rne/Rng family ribonuclease [Rhodospirillum sp.]MCF8490587.1 Rne/Rng family ribonuclease [Rhodospirillum sp.]MCF8498966.1 Rne/Rng family ribonuclease [Rhodospirillum sp.]